MSLRSFIARASFLFIALLLCQCRCIRVCVDFLKDHASKGSDSQFRHNVPARALTFEEFVRSNAHRNLPGELLRKRFDVADADDNGLLTPGEITRHRAAAAQNKRELE